MPGTLGTFKLILNPSYILAEQSGGAGAGSGRVADVGPALAEWGRSPFVGQGFGTRVTARGVRRLQRERRSSTTSG